MHTVIGDMCTFHMMQDDHGGTGYIRKPTKFMTNAICIARQLAQRCPGNHRHIQLVGGRAKAAEVYPDELCKAISRGLVEQMSRDGGMGGIL